MWHESSDYVNYENDNYVRRRQLTIRKILIIKKKKKYIVKITFINFIPRSELLNFLGPAFRFNFNNMYLYIEFRQVYIRSEMCSVVRTHLRNWRLLPNSTSSSLTLSLHNRNEDIFYVKKTSERSTPLIVTHRQT